MPSVGSYIKSVLNRSNAKGDTASSAVNGDRIPDEQRQDEEVDRLTDGPNNDPDPESVRPVPKVAAEGPKPSKIGVLFFYLSVIFTVIGVIILVRSIFYVDEEDKPTVLGIGIGLVVIGLVFIIVTNVINDRERKRILLYLERKIEELRSKENLR